MGSQTWRQAILWLTGSTGVIALAAYLVPCSRAYPRQFQETGEMLQARFSPADAVMLDDAECRRLTNTILVEWSFETKMTWGEYRAWAKSQFPESYRRLADDDDHLRLARTMDGDVLVLSLSRVEGADRLRVHGELKSAPW